MPEAAPEQAPGTLNARRWRLRRWGNRRVVVHDASMAPTLEPGDRLLVDTQTYRDRLPVIGEIVVLVDPQEPRRWLVKRVAGVGPTRLWRTPEAIVPVENRPDASEQVPPDALEAIEVLASFVYVTGDAVDASRDSRRFGAVPVQDLVGRVYRCYAPPERCRDL